MHLANPAFLLFLCAAVTASPSKEGTNPPNTNTNYNPFRPDPSRTNPFGSGQNSASPVPLRRKSSSSGSFGDFISGPSEPFTDKNSASPVSRRRSSSSSSSSSHRKYVSDGADRTPSTDYPTSRHPCDLIQKSGEKYQSSADDAKLHKDIHALVVDVCKQVFIIKKDAAEDIKNYSAQFNQFYVLKEQLPSIEKELQKAIKALPIFSSIKGKKSSPKKWNDYIWKQILSISLSVLKDIQEITEKYRKSLLSAGSHEEEDGNLDLAAATRDHAMDALQTHIIIRGLLPAAIHEGGPSIIHSFFEDRGNTWQTPSKNTMELVQKFLSRLDGKSIAYLHVHQTVLSLQKLIMIRSALSGAMLAEAALRRNSPTYPGDPAKSEVHPSNSSLDPEDLKELKPKTAWTILHRVIESFHGGSIEYDDLWTPADPPIFDQKAAFRYEDKMPPKASSPRRSYKDNVSNSAFNMKTCFKHLENPWMDGSMVWNTLLPKD